MQNSQSIDNQEGDLEDLVTYLLSLENHQPKSVLLDIDTEKMDVSKLFHFLLDLLVSIVRRVYNIELFSIEDYNIKDIGNEIEYNIKKYYKSIGFDINLNKMDKVSFYRYLDDIKCDDLPDLSINTNSCGQQNKLKDYSLNIDLGEKYLNVNFDYLCY